MLGVARGSKSRDRVVEEAARVVHIFSAFGEAMLLFSWPTQVIKKEHDTGVYLISLHAK